MQAKRLSACDRERTRCTHGRIPAGITEGRSGACAAGVDVLFEHGRPHQMIGTLRMLFFGSSQNESLTNRLNRSGGSTDSRLGADTFAFTVCKPGKPSRASNSSALYSICSKSCSNHGSPMNL